jgi:hypothetical protein
MGVVRWRGGSTVVVTILGLIATPVLLGACAHGTCNRAGDDAVFVGRLTARHGGAATYTVESVTATRPLRPGGRVPEPATSTDVHYPESQAKFLHVGAWYRVAVFWSGHEFTSGVHLADDPCSGGTVHLDGSSIDTSLFPWRGKALLALALASVVALLITTAVVWRRRRPKTVRVDDRYLGARQPKR